MKIYNYFNTGHLLYRLLLITSLEQAIVAEQAAQIDSISGYSAPTLLKEMKNGNTVIIGKNGEIR